LWVAAFIPGYAVASPRLDSWHPHIALYYNLVATWRNAKYMIEHNMLMEEVEKRLVTAPASK
jgi:hypothetical protein